MRRAWLLLVGLLALVPEVWANGRISGWCQDGGYTVSLPGVSQPSQNRYQRTFPSCTVTVFRAGTVTPAAIFANDTGTAKANPFTAAANGQWFFYAPDGRYDVRFSGGGIPAPFTLGDLTAFDTARPANTRIPCDSQFAAATMGASIALATADLPATGGIVDASCFQGAQTWTTNIFAGVVKPVWLKLGCVTITQTTGVSTTLPADSRLSGIGECSTIRVAPHGGNYVAGDAPIFLLSGVSNVHIEGIHVTGASGGYPGVDQTWGACILTAGGVSNLTIERSHFADCNGLLIREARQSKIRDNHITGNMGQDGIQVMSQNASLRADFNVVSGNTIQVTKTTGFGSGIRIADRASFNTVSANAVYGDGTGNSTECLIENGEGKNVFTGNTCQGWSWGMAVYGATFGTVITANVLESRENPAVQIRPDITYNVDDVLVSGNTVKTTAGLAHCLQIFDDSPNAARRNKFIGNYIMGCTGSGIQIQTGPDTTIENNQIREAQSFGILINGSTRAVVRGNRIFQHTSGGNHGIYFLDSPGALCQVEGNWLLGTGAGASRAILLETGVTSCIVAHNVASNWPNGIEVISAGNIVGPNIGPTVTFGGDNVNEVSWPVGVNVEFNDIVTFTAETAFNQPLNIGPNPAQSGDVRLENNGAIAWRNPGNTADIIGILVGTGNDVRIAPGGQVIALLGPTVPQNVTQANLSSGTNGSMYYCTNCQVMSPTDNTCAAGGTGAFAVRVNGVYRCFASQN